MHNTDSQYGWLSIILHWLVALAVFGLFILGYWMVDLGYYDTWYQKAPDLHKSIGVCLFIVMVFRLIWRIKQIKPMPLDTHTALEKKLGHWTHLLLYTLLFIIIFSGYLISTADGRGIEVFELFLLPSMGSFIENQEDIAGQIHEYGAYVVITAAIIHALAALKHHYIDKDITLKRMLGIK
jgi:cytochrome b561